MASDTDRVWELMEKISICMLTTHDGERIRSRPMAAFVRRDEDAIYFLGDAHHHKDEEISENPNVGLAFADGQKFVSVTGRAAVSRDTAKIKDLWGPSAKAWWDSPDDPNIRLLTVRPDDAEFWDGPGKIIGTLKMVAGGATNARPHYGENGKVTMWAASAPATTAPKRSQRGRARLIRSSIRAFGISPGANRIICRERRPTCRRCDGWGKSSCGMDLPRGRRIATMAMTPSDFSVRR